MMGIKLIMTLLCVGVLLFFSGCCCPEEPHTHVDYPEFIHITIKDKFSVEKGAFGLERDYLVVDERGVTRYSSDSSFNKMELGRSYLVKLDYSSAGFTADYRGKIVQIIREE